MVQEAIEVDEDGTLTATAAGDRFLLVPARDKPNAGHYAGVVALLNGDRNKAYSVPGPVLVTPGEAFDSVKFVNLTPGDWWVPWVLPTAMAGWSGPAQPDRRPAEVLAEVQYAVNGSQLPAGTYYLWPGGLGLKEVTVNGKPEPFDFRGCARANLVVKGGLGNGTVVPHVLVGVKVTVEGATDGTVAARPCAPAMSNGQQPLALGDKDVTETFRLFDTDAAATLSPALKFDDGAEARQDGDEQPYYPSTCVVGPLPRFGRVRVEVAAPGQAPSVPPIVDHPGLYLLLERERGTIASAW